MRAAHVMSISLLLLGMIFLFQLKQIPVDAAEEDGETDASQKPNVVVILFDTLRPDYLGPYGFEPETSPFISKLAAESTIFTRAFSTSSWTAPSTASVFTGTYPTEHGVVLGMGAHDDHIELLERTGKASIALNRFAHDVTTLPEFFKANGYLTFGLASNRNIGKEIGFTRGFKLFEGHYREPAEVILENLEPWVDRLHKLAPFFLYVHLDDMHLPYEPEEPYYSKLEGIATGDRRNYLSEIGYIDAYLEKIYNLVVADRNTILVLLSDHGEEFQDHGLGGHSPRLYREVNQVLMMAHAPDGRINSQVIDLNVSLIDVYPTLVELCGFDAVDFVQGVSLAPLLDDDVGDVVSEKLRTDLRQRTLFAHRATRVDASRSRWAATFQHWKLFEPWGRGPELYDHRVDPSEHDNVFDREPEVAARLTKWLAEFKKTMRDQSDSAVEVPLDRELAETLEALGYVE